MAREVLHVLEKESLWPLLCKDAAHVEEESPLRLVLEARFAAEAVLLGHTGDRERLTGETADQDVMVGNVFGVDLRYVIVGDLMEVGLIGLTAKFVPFV